MEGRVPSGELTTSFPFASGRVDVRPACAGSGWVSGRAMDAIISKSDRARLDGEGVKEGVGKNTNTVAQATHGISTITAVPAKERWPPPFPTPCGNHRRVTTTFRVSKHEGGIKSSFVSAHHSGLIWVLNSLPNAAPLNQLGPLL